jgi:hypothetical protein
VRGMIIAYERTPTQFVQCKEFKGKKYYCLLEVMKEIGILADKYSFLNKDNLQPVYIKGEIIYGFMHCENGFLLAPFIEESEFKRLTKGRHR